MYATFIVKTNIQYFPKDVLHEVLLACFGGRPASYWVVMKANISGIDTMIMAYAWSMKGICYIFSSCGKSVCHERDCVTKFTDYCRQPCSKALLCPTITILCFTSFLPLMSLTNNDRAYFLLGKNS